MLKPQDAWRETSWLTVRQLADALDVSTDYVRREVVRRTPESMIRRELRPMRVYARGAIELWLQSQRLASACDDAISSAIDLDLLP
ncbi:MAG: hypothetical protein AAFV43_12035 [Planctomycetota bacterium]